MYLYAKVYNFMALLEIHYHTWKVGYWFRYRVRVS